MTVGAMGVVRPVRGVPKPNSEVTGAAIELLRAFGGGTKEVRELLAEMHAVQAHNDAVVVEAKAAVADANKRTAETVAAEQALDKAAADFAVEVNETRARLAKLDQEIKDRKVKANDELDARSEALDAREKLIGVREDEVASRGHSCQEREAACSRRETAVNFQEIESARRKAELDAAYERLRAAMPQA